MITLTSLGGQAVFVHTNAVAYVRPPVGGEGGGTPAGSVIEFQSGKTLMVKETPLTVANLINAGP